MSLRKNGSVSSEVVVRLEERLLHFMLWLSKRRNVILTDAKTGDHICLCCSKREEIDKLIIEYVEG